MRIGAAAPPAGAVAAGAAFFLLSRVYAGILDCLDHSNEDLLVQAERDKQLKPSDAHTVNVRRPLQFAQPLPNMSGHLTSPAATIPWAGEGVACMDQARRVWNAEG